VHLHGFLGRELGGLSGLGLGRRRDRTGNVQVLVKRLERLEDR